MFDWLFGKSEQDAMEEYVRKERAQNQTTQEISVIYATRNTGVTGQQCGITTNRLSGGIKGE